MSYIRAANDGDNPKTQERWVKQRVAVAEAFLQANPLPFPAVPVSWLSKRMGNWVTRISELRTRYGWKIDCIHVADETYYIVTHVGGMPGVDDPLSPAVRAENRRARYGAYHPVAHSYDEYDY